MSGAEIKERNYEKRYKLMCRLQEECHPKSKKVATRTLIAGDKLRGTNYSGRFPQWKSVHQDLGEAMAVLRKELAKDDPDPHAVELAQELNRLFGGD